MCVDALGGGLMTEPWHAIQLQLADLFAPVVAAVARPVG